mmetsp:Transcript_14415/g.23823  ORF Transcript_14415/g.23823 Transcript_14415/m.23823 type:complete len:144 (-) Transcript_14415:56-487(-)
MSVKISLLLLASALLVLVPSGHALQQPPSSRRAFFAAVPVAAVAVAAPLVAGALDMDAFMNKELTKSDTPAQDKYKQMSNDEGLCRYGAPSRNTGEACERAGISPKRANGLDAFGNIDRGDFVRCKTYYLDKGDRYEKKVVCE